MDESRTLEIGRRLTRPEKRVSEARRDAALARGEVYFTYPAKCSKGHDPLRYAIDSKCVRCVSDAKASRHSSEKQRAYRLKNIEMVRASKLAWKARRKGAAGEFDHRDVFQHFLMQGGLCAGPICRCRLDDSGYHVDHIIPVSKGGSNWPDNLQLLCPNCNVRKSAKMPEFWN